MTFVTKFDIGQIVWVAWANRAVEVKVHTIHIECLPDRTEIVYQCVDKGWQPGGMSYYGLKLLERFFFATKNELLESL